MNEKTSNAQSSATLDIARAYDKWAQQYDANANATRDLDGALLRVSSLEVHNRVILEAGCGTGKNTGWLAEHAHSVIAMDFSAGMLARARTRVSATNVRWLAHDMNSAWPIADEFVDIVCFDLVLEHVHNLAAVFTEAARVLRSGGRMRLSELHPLRQQRGGQAHFTDDGSGATTMIPAFLHSIDEYLEAATAAAMRVIETGEGRDDDAPGDVEPRIFTAIFERRYTS